MKVTVQSQKEKEAVEKKDIRNILAVIKTKKLKEAIKNNYGEKTFKRRYPRFNINRESANRT
jgi:hypothetical protein